MLYSSEQRGGRTAFHQLSTDLGPEALPCIFDLTFEQASGIDPRQIVGERLLEVGANVRIHPCMNNDERCTGSVSLVACPLQSAFRSR